MAMANGDNPLTTASRTSEGKAGFEGSALFTSGPSPQRHARQRTEGQASSIGKHIRHFEKAT